jgi:hypothetical protein
MFLRIMLGRGEQLVQFLEQDIADRKLLGLIRQGMKAGHLEGSLWYSDQTGIMQGCVWRCVWG